METLSTPCGEYALHLVLVEPEIPQNTGNIARTCAATGARLHLIEPMGFRVDDAKLRRAGLDYWHLLEVTYHRNLEDFFARTQGAYYYFSTKAARVYTEINYPKQVYFLFGKETAGLPEALLEAQPERCVRLPMIPEARSLNLSNAAAVAAYEALRQWGYPRLRGASDYFKEAPPCKG
ncbi:MAG: tRNA (uridine(34)/cytosine(34)/5-carboxymethylaminomethyluridine(34)-2'-O)-methyltransferase TrmL [Oscillospiraceae bacterium]|nr:tRNA (uridine(34)/cytosine(34)/5-carboxymethylaminomethyluridine(34)-2'-O)-methyltransferase TrmL [Oscillospiraceae bacterium]